MKERANKWLIPARSRAEGFHRVGSGFESQQQNSQRRKMAAGFRGSFIIHGLKEGGDEASRASGVTFQVSSCLKKG